MSCSSLDLISKSFPVPGEEGGGNVTVTEPPCMEGHVSPWEKEILAITCQL